VEVLEVVPDQKGLRITTRTTETGLDPTVRELLVIPGKATFLADMISADLHIDLKKPMALNKTSAKPGKRNKIRGSGRAFFEGTLIGSAAFGGSWVFAGLEPLDTPADSIPTPPASALSRHGEGSDLRRFDPCCGRIGFLARARHRRGR
jgi:hypothetical protein